MLVVVAFAATGCMGRSVSGSGSAGRTSLEISISSGTKDAPTKVWTLRCPAGGTLPDPARACSRLESLANPFAPVPKEAACTQVFGGPQIAEVQGTFRGEPVDSKFTRSDGCEIARWNRVEFLFPSG